MSRAADREQRWDEIIHAAAAGFYEKGYEATSLQDIANSVGLLKGSIYYYIDTKEDLLFELVMRSQLIWRETIAEPEELASGSAPTRLGEFIRRWMLLKEREREWGIVAEREFTRLSPEPLAKVKAGRKEFSAFVEGIVSQGVTEGDFDSGLDVALGSTMVIELIKSGHLHRRPRANLDIVAMADSYAGFAIRGLGDCGWTPEPSAPAPL